MEALGIIFPGARMSGVRAMRPTLPSRRLVRPILEIAHRAAGLDPRAYHRGDGDEEEEMEDLPGIEGDGYWNISDDGSEWEELSILEEEDQEGSCFNDDGKEDDDGAVLFRRGDTTSANATATAIQRAIRGVEMAGADRWEVVNRMDGTPGPENEVREASEVSTTLGGGYQTNSRQGKAKKPEYKGSERVRYWKPSLERPHRTSRTRGPDRSINGEHKPDCLEEERHRRNSTAASFSASHKTTKLMEAAVGPEASLTYSSHEEPAWRLRNQDDSDTSSQDGVHLQAQQTAFEEFIRIAESADGSASSLVSVSTPMSRNLSSVLSPQGSFNSVDSGNRISLVRMSGVHQHSDFKPEFIHHWLEAQGEGRYFRKRVKQVMFRAEWRVRQDTVARE